MAKVELSSIFFYSISITVLSFGIATARAEQNKDIEFLQGHRRPKVEEMLALFKDGLPAKNPFVFETDPLYREAYGDGQNSTATIAKNLKLYGAMVIAQLERAYPGATYACLGRDMTVLGEFLQSFYLSIGQKDRVRILDASTETLQGVKPQKIVEWMKGYGLDMQKPDEVLSGPRFVIIDNSRYKDFSQPNIILSALFAAFRDAGGDPLQLRGHVGFVGTGFDGGGSSRFAKITSFPDRKQLQAFLTYEDEALIPRKAVTLSVPDLNVDLSHSAEWHEPFSVLEYKDGKVLSDPGPRRTRTEIRVAAAQMYEAIKIGQSSDMLERVQQASRELGFEFSPRTFSHSGCAETFGGAK